MTRCFRLALLGIFCIAAPADAATPLERLKADLLGGGSATQVLTGWCADLKLASPPVIRAERAVGPAPQPDTHVRALLMADANDVIRTRRVRLMCGTNVLSEADNWYLPGRLTGAMNRTLDTSETPFGAVVRPLNFHRRTLEVVEQPDPETVLRIEALLIRADGRPFSLVVENYRRDLVTAR